MSELGDILYLTTADKRSMFSPDNDVRFRVYGGFGAPPVNFLTRRGYKQHGATEIDYLLDPRTISVELWHSPACSRQVYWDNRLGLHEFLRHNRGGPILFVLREPNGKKRALYVRANPGLQFPMPDIDNNNWNIDEVIDFIAFDPIWFDPDSHRNYIASVVDLNLVFPITFPIRFGSSTIISANSITYVGTWESFPVITLFGPYTSATLINSVTAARIYLTIAIAGGESRIIKLTPGAQSVTDASSANRFSELGIDTNLVDFSIRPDPEAVGGIQQINAIFTGGLVGTTGFQVEYNDRYFAL